MKTIFKISLDLQKSINQTYAPWKAGNFVLDIYRAHYPKTKSRNYSLYLYYTDTSIIPIEKIYTVIDLTKSDKASYYPQYITIVY